MADILTGKKIKDTYQGLIKTNDNGPIGLTASALTDGLGNELPLQISSTDVNFTGNVDFTGATVSGLPIGEAGLVAGTGVNSMKSSSSLTAIGATASGQNTIAIGNEAQALGGTSDDGRGVAIGWKNNVTQRNAVSIGNQNTVGNDGAITIGMLNVTSNDRGVMIGYQNTTNASGQDKINIGTLTTTNSGDRAIAIGRGSVANAASTIAIGNGTSVTGGDTTVVGVGSSGAGIRSTALGRNNVVNASNSIALGNFCRITGGATNIVMTTNTLSWRDINATNVIVISPGAENGGASGTGSIVLGVGTGDRANSANGVAIGTNSISSAAGAIALGAVTAATADTTTTKKLQLVDTVAMDYADDAAAATAGVPVGGIYHTSGVLKIRLV